MISYEELDRALSRWKARAQGGGAVDVSAAAFEARAEADASPEFLGEPTPLPIPSEELGSIPNLAAPGPERTGELDVAELETYIEGEDEA